jgi:hypothetical protein
MRFQRNFFLLLLSIGCISATFFFYLKIFVPLQAAEWKGQQRPVGIRSDFYPAWFAAREFLLKGVNPYSAEVTAGIQERAYGRKLQPENPNDWRDQQRFAYPLYVVVIMGPLVLFEFGHVEFVMFPVMFLATVLASWCWLRVFQLPRDAAITGAVALLTLANWQGIEAIVLQQPSLLVAALVAAGVCLYVSGWYGVAGALFAVAMIKPQLALPVTCWILLSAIAKWKERKNCFFGFALVVGFLLVVSEFLMPGWFGYWRQNAKAYSDYVGGNAFLLTLVFGNHAGVIISGLLLLSTTYLVWRNRSAVPNSTRFNATLALVMSCTVGLPPIWHYYDEILLVPVVLAGVQALRMKSLTVEARLIIIAGFVIISASLLSPPLICVLSAIHLLPDAFALNLPLFPAVFTPVAALGIGLYLAARKTGDNQEPQLSAM